VDLFIFRAAREIGAGVYCRHRRACARNTLAQLCTLWFGHAPPIHSPLGSLLGAAMDAAQAPLLPDELGEGDIALDLPR
jgi:hypothetical protein